MDVCRHPNLLFSSGTFQSSQTRRSTLHIFIPSRGRSLESDISKGVKEGMIKVFDWIQKTLLSHLTIMLHPFKQKEPKESQISDPLFELVSSQEINWSKSSFVGINYSHEVCTKYAICRCILRLLARRLVRCSLGRDLELKHLLESGYGRCRKKVALWKASQQHNGKPITCYWGRNNRL